MLLPGSHFSHPRLPAPPEHVESGFYEARETHGGKVGVDPGLREGRASRCGAEKGGRCISFTLRSSSLSPRSGAMTPLSGRAGAAAHPKDTRRPPFSAPPTPRTAPRLPGLGRTGIGAVGLSAGARSWALRNDVDVIFLSRHGGYLGWRDSGADVVPSASCTPPRTSAPACRWTSWRSSGPCSWTASSWRRPSFSPTTSPPTPGAPGSPPPWRAGGVPDTGVRFQSAAGGRRVGAGAHVRRRDHRRRRRRRPHLSAVRRLPEPWRGPRHRARPR